MKVAEYKGYEIEFGDWGGQFNIKGISGWFEKYKDATAKIDRVVKAEVKENFPVDVVSSSMKVGKITSYNKAEQDAWFSPEGGSRGKERLMGYDKKPRFYNANEANLNLVKKYKGVEKTINQLSDDQRHLEKQLTEPISFEVSEA